MLDFNLQKGTKIQPKTKKKGMKIAVFKMGDQNSKKDRIRRSKLQLSLLFLKNGEVELYVFFFLISQYISKEKSYKIERGLHKDHLKEKRI